MAISIIITASLLGLTQDNNLVQNWELGLQYSLPKEWKSTTKKGISTYIIPIEGGTAKVDLSAAMFHSEMSQWELIQSTMATQMKRTLENQWREEMLSVPLLLTKTNYSLKDQPTTALSGLLYSATPRKLLFNLVCDSNLYPAAESKWREVLLTFRTIDGKMPTSEDPNRKVDPAEFKNSNPKANRVVKLDPGRTKQKAYVKAPQAVEIETAGRMAILCFPKEWTAETLPNSQAVLKHPSIEDPVMIQAYSTLDSPTLERTLLSVAAGSLDEFTKVLKREETRPSTNAAGASVRQIWRFGTDNKSGLSTCIAGGQTDQLYWVLTYKHSGVLKSNMRKLVEGLVQAMSLEPKG